MHFFKTNFRKCFWISVSYFYNLFLFKVSVTLVSFFLMFIFTQTSTFSFFSGLRTVCLLHPVWLWHHCDVRGVHSDVNVYFCMLDLTVFISMIKFSLLEMFTVCARARFIEKSPYFKFQPYLLLRDFFLLLEKERKVLGHQNYNSRSLFLSYLERERSFKTITRWQVGPELFSTRWTILNSTKASSRGFFAMWWCNRLENGRDVDRWIGK